MPDAVPEELFEVTPADFVAARDRIVKGRRAAGERDGAAQIAKLRRPAPTVWALNRLARRQPETVELVLAAGERLRAAMATALAGDASAVRSAQADERAAVDAALSAANAAIRELGQLPTEALSRRMAETLRAAVLDGDVASRLRSGTLEMDAQAEGFGLVAAGDVSLPGSVAREQASRRVQERRDEADRVKAHAEVERLEQRAQRLRATADEAQRRLPPETRAHAESAEAEAQLARQRLTTVLKTETEER